MKCSKLIKVGTHYVPWNYRNWDDTKKPRDESLFEDVNAVFPLITWSEHFQKWKVTFTGAYIGGYDVETFTWYYDSIDDIIKAMMPETVPGDK